MATLQNAFAQSGAQQRAANPEKFAWLDKFNAMQAPPTPVGGTQLTQPTNAREIAEYNNSPAAQQWQQMRQQGRSLGYIQDKQHDWLDRTTDYLPYAGMAALTLGAAGALGGAAGATEAGAGGATGAGAGTATGGAASGLAGGSGTVGGIFGGGAATGGGLAGGVGATGVGAGTALGGAGTAAGSGLTSGAGAGIGNTLLGNGATVFGSGGGSAGTAMGGSSGSGWFSHFGEGAGTAAGSALSGKNLLNLGIGAGIDALTADRARNQANSAADKAAGLADPFASQRPQYQEQLSNLMAHPESINQDPSYQFRLKSGQDALERSNAARGYLGSGNMNIDLQNYGQQSASQELNNQYARLAQLSGGMSGAGYAGNVFGGLANTGLADSTNMTRSLGTAGGALIRGLTRTGSTGDYNASGNYNTGMGRNPYAGQYIS